MSEKSLVMTLSPRDYDAVLFDLDGVLTQTTGVHAAAWKKLFDAFLEQRAAETGTPFVPFDIETDYRLYVDGKSRADGVAAFLAARGIDLPWGTPDDQPGLSSVYGLGSRKDQYFQSQLAEAGVLVYEASIALVHDLRAQGVRTAVVSSSNNCAAVLQAAGIAGLFDARVDGRAISCLGLAGKPAPDAYLEAARRLGVDPARAVVIEDAISGVAAGRAGHFGLVIGVDRGHNRDALLAAGADSVVDDLAEVCLAPEPSTEWSLVYEGFDPAQQGIREALCTLGNGYFATRAATPGAVADDVHYPGTYLACGYNRLRTPIAGRVVENEDLVNFPNWLVLQFCFDGRNWFDERHVTLLEYRQTLDLRQGVLFRDVRFEDAQGRRTRLRERRLVSMDDMHMAGIEISVTAENWSGSITIRSALDGRVVNDGAQLYKKFNNRHLEPVLTEAVGDDAIALLVRTSQSRIDMAQAARTRLFQRGRLFDCERRLLEEPGYVAHEFELEVVQEQPLVVEKVVALYTSRDPAISESRLAACKAITRAPRFEALMDAQVLAWKHLWRRFDMHMRPAGEGFRLNVIMMLRLNMFHLLQTVSPNSIGLDIGVPARGWTGEAYQGHVFWDELFIFPFFNHRMPEITRWLLMYRFRRLGEARAAAKRAGFEGAMFPWQSASDGQEETQTFNLNPRSQRWVPDNSYHQRHVGSAIAYNVWQYFQATHDLEFMQSYGADLMLSIAQFWSSLATFNPERGRYDIRGVMGPDEFHEAYPDATVPGIDNNAYTNMMAAWIFCRGLDLLELMSPQGRHDIMQRLGLSPQELARWDDISRKLYIPFHEDGVISQFEGYENLIELDWEHYRARYGNIQRLDLILEAENDTPNRYKLSKQPDVLMLFYLFSHAELQELLTRLGYPWRDDAMARNVAYYSARSSHGSTLSRVVHAWVHARTDRAQAMQFFVEALQSDLGDIQQGTAAEGIHLGAMAGSVDLVERVSTGIEMTRDVLRLNPELPPEMERLEMRVHYRGHSLDLLLTCDTLRIRGRNQGPAPIRISVEGSEYEFASGAIREFPLRLNNNCDDPARRRRVGAS